MFLHLGGEVVIRTKNIIAIMDMESTLKSKDSAGFLKTCEEEGFVHKITEEEPRTFIITEEVEKQLSGENLIRKIVVYYSPISTLTLQKRAGFIQHNT